MGHTHTLLVQMACVPSLHTGRGGRVSAGGGAGARLGTTGVTPGGGGGAAAGTTVCAAGLLVVGAVWGVVTG